MRLSYLFVTGLVIRLSGLSYGLYLDVHDPTSIREAAATIAFGLMKYYRNNATDTAPSYIGLLAFPPYYWWESGAMWGGMIDYYTYTGDDSYVPATIQGLTAQVGPNRNFIVPEHKYDEGNDDQAFWGLALMSAIENRYPDPPSNQPQWLPLLEALFDNQASRWDTTGCGGGLKWQIYPENAYGYNYKNSISNGAFFQLAARLARYTGDQKYVTWAERTWDWCRAVDLVADNYDVYDGTDDRLDCRELDHTRWSYNVAVFLEGAAALYSLTGSDIWAERIAGLLDASKSFFSPNENSSNIMYEPGCEPYGTCNVDQQSFKAYLARWLAKTAVLVPFTAPTIRLMLEASASGAAASCSGGLDGVTCGSKWYQGSWDGTWGVGQQLSALEVVQALLGLDAGLPFSRHLSSNFAKKKSFTLNSED